MGAEFDSETIKMREGQNLTDVLKEVLKEKGQADRMDSENGLFFTLGAERAKREVPMPFRVGMKA